MIMLSIQNASRVTEIEHINHPEWGVKRFNYTNSRSNACTYGSGSDSSVLYESNYRFWVVKKLKYVPETTKVVKKIGPKFNPQPLYVEFNRIQSELVKTIDKIQANPNNTYEDISDYTWLLATKVKGLAAYLNGLGDYYQDLADKDRVHND